MLRPRRALLGLLVIPLVIVTLSAGSDRPAAAGPTAVGSAAAGSAAAVILEVNKPISLQVTTPGFTDKSLRHRDSVVDTSPINAGSSGPDKADATFVVRSGLADGACYSFESTNYPGDFLRHADSRVRKDRNDGSALFRADATFCAVTGNTGSNVSLRAYNYPNKFLRHIDSQVWIASNGGPDAWDTGISWAADTTWKVIAPWSSSGGGGGGGPFGNTTIHPEKLGLYAIPDLYWTDANRLQNSLTKVKSILPNTWIRWDNETGHYRNTPAAVETFVRQANDAGLPMIVAACCVDGYDNWWARGGSQPVVSIRQIADGPYLSFAQRLRTTFPNVRYIETINEPDTHWFVADPDNVDNWNYYMDKLYAATGNDHSRLMGPATAFPNSKIYQNTVARNEIQQISYHTYGGWNALYDVPGKQGTWVTEYGDDGVSDAVEQSPGWILSDLRNAERNNKLSGSIQKIFYVDLQKMISANTAEGSHYAFSGQLRTLAAYQALGSISTRAWTDAGADDIVAADNGAGTFGALVWNRSESGNASGRTRVVPTTSVAPGTALSVLTVFNRSTGSAECRPLAGQSRVSATINNGSVSVTMNSVEPLTAVYLSTKPCDSLAD